VSLLQIYPNSPPAIGKIIHFFVYLERAVTWGYLSTTSSTVDQTLADQWPDDLSSSKNDETKRSHRRSLKQAIAKTLAKEIANFGRRNSALKFAKVQGEENANLLEGWVKC